MQITRSPNGTHDIVRVQVSDSVRVEFRSYELIDPTWVKLSAVRQLYSAGWTKDTLATAEEIVDLVMRAGEVGDAA